jgi:hypothetical protein
MITTVLGELLLLVGIVGIANALFMDTTVDASHQDGYRYVEERVYNQGLNHERQIRMLASGVAFLAGTMTLGFCALCHNEARTRHEIASLAAIIVR